jgi:tetratricopeptide (TPR) repeat protein
MRGSLLVTSALLGGVFGLVAGFHPVPAGAVQAPSVEKKQETRPATADRLEAVAMELLSMGDMDTWEQAAELLERSARLRPEDSLSKATSLKIAANLYNWIGETEQARDLLEEAAECAQELGALSFAAHTFLDAAVLSAELRMGRHTVAAAQMAERLAASPDMPRADQDVIKSRIQRLNLPLSLADIM